MSASGYDATNPPPLEAPAGVPAPGLWPVLVRQWLLHRPEPPGFCRCCGLRFPCPGHRDLDDALAEQLVRAESGESRPG